MEQKCLFFSPNIRQKIKPFLAHQQVGCNYGEFKITAVKQAKTAQTNKTHFLVLGRS